MEQLYLKKHNSIVCRQLISNSIMYRLCSHCFFIIVCAHCYGSTGNSSGACTRRVHEELACTCCSLWYNYAGDSFSFQDSFPSKLLSLVVSQSTYHYLTMQLSERFHGVVEKAKSFESVLL